MSLINEALRKARQAASENESKQPDGVFRPTKAYPSRRSGRGGGPLTVALIAIATGVICASAAWWILKDRQVASTEPIISEARSIDAEPVTTPVPSPTPVEEQPEARSREASAEVVPTPVVVPAGDPQATADTPAGQPMDETPPPELVIGPDGERIFVLEAELGYASLSLGFIVARSANPFAEINGTDVYVGSEIDGFVVESIESDRVVLRDDKGPLILRVP